MNYECHCALHGGKSLRLLRVEQELRRRLEYKIRQGEYLRRRIEYLTRRIESRTTHGICDCEVCHGTDYEESPPPYEDNPDAEIKELADYVQRAWS
jgi:hypothetical protein